MHSDISAGFIIWIATTQCVNFAFYLAITRVARGWRRTIAAYFVYFAALAAIFPLTPLAHGSEHGTAGTLSLTFVGFFTLWGILTIVMSRGAVGRSLFAVILCGAHQLIAFAASLLIIHHASSTITGALLASGVMALMGWFLVAFVIPRTRRMPDRSGWTYLNVMTIAIFALLYAAGIWPIYVPTGSLENIIIFAVAAVVAVVFFPTAIAFSAKSHQASSLASVEENLRMMAEQLESRRETIAKARQIRNDRRSRCEAIIEMLKLGKIDEALTYLNQLKDEASDLQSSQSVWCTNETINAVLSGYERKSEAAGVRFSAMASIGEQSELPELEMVELITNLLEVAIRTTRAHGEVTCLIQQQKDSFGVTVTNTAVPDLRLSDDGLPLAASDTNLSNAINLARKCHSECHYRLNDGRLTCEVILAVRAPGVHS